ncbi:hypothetical protein C7410_115166 [Paraburkholderia silvatlantica]|uniref:Uncharacterized protein n=1 Tax=Paraburkholderia silvatlantica TaxID=321895 RepID=A0A2V4TT55_9BURK|nr:hypothetical protein [Paraburkholderia silvatlantica]PYE21323.1 hypothetical protein C7410_115166 [Paraburkholderia silvatlantica]
MNTVQFVMMVLNWLQGDPTHIVAAAALLNSLIPTPNPMTTAGKVYKVLELLALSFLRAKETGVPAQSPSVLADQIAEAIAKKTANPVTPQ